MDQWLNLGCIAVNDSLEKQPINTGMSQIQTHNLEVWRVMS